MTKTGSLIGLGALLFLPASLLAEDEKVDLFEAKVELRVEIKPIVVEAGSELADKLKEEAPVKKPEKPEDGLSLEVRTALREFAVKAGKVRRSQLLPDFEKSLTELTAAAKLDPAAVAKLTAVMPAAVDEGMKDWEDKFCDWLTPYLLEIGDPAGMLQSWKPEQLASNTGQFKVTPPAQTVVWKEALKTTLTPEQTQLLGVAEAAEKAKVLEEITPFLETVQGQAQESFSGVMDIEMEKILQYTTLEEDRVKKLRAAATEAVKVTLQGWRDRAQEKILAMDAKSRQQMVTQNGTFGVDPQEKANLPQEQEAWLKARKEFLTDAESRTLTEGLQEIKQRRVDALAMTIISDLDRLVGFSGAQRVKLLELARPCLDKLDKEFFEGAANGYFSLNPGTMLVKLREIPETDLTAVLQPGQLKRWKAVNPEQLSGNRTYYRRNAGKAEATGEALVDPWEPERLIGLTIAQEAVKLRQMAFSQFESQVESIVRVNTLPPETMAVLLTAAKGAAEQTSRNAINNVDQNVHQQMQGVKPADVAARLKGISLSMYQERNGIPDPKVWKAALERVLTPPQQEAWKQECKEADEWHYHSLSALIATEIGKKVLLKPDKNALLEQKIEAVLRTYDEEISNFLSRGWHLQSYYNAVPVAFLTEAEMAEIFTAKEIETVRTRCLGQAQQYADMIKQQHTIRVKNKR